MICRPGSALNILVVEDEWLIREMTCLYLREVGWEVIEAETGEQAVDVLRGGQPIDVVFTDIRLKGRLTGWDVGDAARDYRQDIPVIYTSATAPLPSRQVAGSRFLSKPYNPSTVHRTCQTLASDTRRCLEDGLPRSPVGRHGLHSKPDF